MVRIRWIVAYVVAVDGRGAGDWRDTGAAGRFRLRIEFRDIAIWAPDDPHRSYRRRPRRAGRGRVARTVTGKRDLARAGGG